MGLESDVLGRWYYLAELTYDNALARNISQSGIPKPRAVWEVAFDCDHYPVLNFKGVPQEKLRRSSSTKNRHVFNTGKGKAVGEATPPIWREHFKTLLNRQAPSAPELEYVHRLTFLVNGEPRKEPEVLTRIQKMRGGRRRK
ncbi:hypothetical protein RB195_016735 [Necator americanus]|uniref:Uncharacterized protein n=1 Tax=Necator americanus TaxID=51031 RepID=A0ABR1C3F9_NECAM